MRKEEIMENRQKKHGRWSGILENRKQEKKKEIR